MLLGLKRDFLGKSNAEEVYWSYNMISDLNKENFIKIKAFVLDFIRNSPGIQAFDVKNDDYGEKNPIYQIFWSLILIYLFENEQITIKQAFLRVFETFKEFFSIIFTEKDFAIKQLILFLVIIKRILSNSSLFHATLLKISEIFSKETSFISSWSKNSFLKSKSLFANEKISNKASSKDISTCNYYIMSNLADKSDNNENNEEIQIFCKDIFEVFLNETLDKMLLRVEILLYNTNIPFSSFNL